jgi:hypothetical protein
LEKAMKRPVYIVGAAVICVVAFFVYFATRMPEGVAPMDGESSATVNLISLATAIVTLLITILGLVQKLAELRANKGR